MPDMKISTEAGHFEYFCATCGSKIEPKKKCTRVEVMNLFGNVHDYLVLCGTCSRRQFPATKVLP